MKSHWDIKPAVYAWATLVLFFLVLPLLVVVPLSFSSSPYLQFPPPGWSLRWYEAYLSDYAWVTATIRSLKIATSTAVLSTLLGTMLSFSLVRGTYAGKSVVLQLSTTPLIVPSIIYSVAVYSTFAQFKLIGDWRGIVLAHTVLAIPYVTLVISAALRTFDANLELAAMGLGASRIRAIWRVTLPVLRPSVVSAIFLAFISSFDELVVAMFLGGAEMTLPKKMFDNIVNEIDPTIAAVSVLQIILVVGALAAVHKFGAGSRNVHL
jgi:ABC-type spermidine/putrescine transport system permease subunit II